MPTVPWSSKCGQPASAFDQCHGKNTLDVQKAADDRIEKKPWLTVIRLT